MELRSFFCQLFLTMLLCAAVRATTIEKLSLEEMTYLAQRIVRARCISNSSFWAEGEIWTSTSLEVLETLKGPSTNRIEVRLLGGTVGGLDASVSGVPRFRQGDEVILFLEPTRHGDLTVVSWQQGTMRILYDSRTGVRVVTQDSAEFETFDPQTRSFKATGIHDVPLKEFRVRVKAAVAASARRKS
jgi:hypothetical protein